MVILNQFDPGEGAKSALDVCQDIKRKMIGVNTTFFIIAKTQADLEEGRRTSSSIVPVDNWITEPLSIDYIRTRIRMSILRSKCQWEDAPIPMNEVNRLRALHESHLLNVIGPESLCRIGRIARTLFNVST